MAYAVVLDAIDEPEFEGYHCVHIPMLKFATHGKGINGALVADEELWEIWIADKRAGEESVRQESGAGLASIEMPMP